MPAPHTGSQTRRSRRTFRATRRRGAGAAVGTFDTRTFALLSLGRAGSVRDAATSGVIADGRRIVRRNRPQWAYIDPPRPGVGAGDRSASPDSALGHQGDRQPPREEPQRQTAALIALIARSFSGSLDDASNRRPR